MKKVLFMLPLLVVLCMFAACSKDDEQNSFSMMVNVFVDGNIASPVLVRLYDYEDTRKCEFDYDTMCEYGDHRKLVDKNGNELTPKYTSDSFNGINTFESVESGKYTIIAMYKPEGFTWPMFYYYGYKDIIVDKNNDAILHKIDLKKKEKGKFVEF